MSAALYERLAPFYDLIYEQVTEDIPFYLALAEESGGPVLELGCGSGRILLPLAAAGVAVTGLDNSPAMLGRAQAEVDRRDLGDRVRLALGDMANLDLGGEYPLITVPFNSWMHLESAAQMATALRGIRRHLAPGGRLVIDVPAPATIVDAEHDSTLVLEATFALENGETLLQFSSTRLDMRQQLLHVTWLYDHVGQDGQVQRTVLPMALRYLFPYEAELMVQRAGLELIGLWGDYDRSPYSAVADHLLIVAGRPR